MNLAASNFEDEMTTPTEEEATLLTERASAYERFEQEVASAGEALHDKVQRIDARLNEIRAKARELRILIRRTQGPALTTYHSASHPCQRVEGRGRARGNFREARESEGPRLALRRCSACNWRAAEDQARAPNVDSRAALSG